MKKLSFTALIIFCIFIFSIPAGATPKFVDTIPSCDADGNVTIPPLPTGATFLNVEIYDDIRGIKPRMIGPVSAFRLQLGESFNFLWKDSEDCVWYQMITPFSKASGLLTDCSDPRGCKYTFQGDMQPKSVTAVLYTGNSPNVYDGTLKDNSKPCGDVPCTSSAPTPIVQQVAPAPVIQTPSTPAPVVVTSVAVAKSSPPVSVKRPAREKECDPCIVAVKVDTEAIRKSVGDVDPAEVFEEQTLQNKGKMNLQISKEMKASVGEGKADENGKVLSFHEKIGEPEKKGENLFGDINDIKQDVKDIKEKVNAPPKKYFGEWWWLAIAILAAIVVLYLWQQQGRRRPANSAP